MATSSKLIPILSSSSSSSSSSPKPRTIVLCGGYALLHMYEEWKALDLLNECNFIFYITPHFTVGADACYDSFQWGQSIAHFPPYSQARLKALLNLENDFNEYLPIWAVRLWCQKVLEDMEKRAINYRSTFECYVSEKFEIKYEIDFDKKIQNVIIKDAIKDVITSHTLSNLLHFVSGVVRPNIHRTPKYKNFLMDSQSFFKYNPKTSTLGFLPYLIVGKGPSALWICEILLKLKKKVAFLELELAKLPTNPRNKDLVDKIKKRPKDFTLSPKCVVYRVKDLFDSQEKDDLPLKNIFKQTYKKYVPPEIEDCAVIFEEDPHDNRYYNWHLRNVVMSIGFDPLIKDKALKENEFFTDATVTPLQATDEYKTGVVTDDQWGGVCHQVNKLRKTVIKLFNKGS